MTAFRDRKSFTTVRGLQMAWVEDGPEGGAPDGTPTVVMLHGNPTSSYLWRDVWPHVRDLARVVVPDLLGMGDSDKLAESGPGAYSFATHREHLDDLLDVVVPDDPLVLVVHDWGSALGFDWANRHRDRVAGIAHMESIVQPVGWDQWPDAAVDIFRALRSEAGEALCLDKNLFVENILPASVLATLPDAVMEEYRRPFATAGEGRRPTLDWPRQIPLDGEPADVAAVVADYAAWLARSHGLPKLFVDADPGMILTGAQREFARRWPDQREVVVPGLHFLQEDSGEAIGRALRAWLVEDVLGASGAGPAHDPGTT